MKRIHILLTVFLILNGWVNGSDPVGSTAEAGNRPNVLLVVFDDLNDYLGSYNSHAQAVTPHLDRLADMGIRFTNAHTTGAWCAPARVSLINGFYPHTTRTYRGQTIRETPLFEDVVNVFQHFRAHGYRTYGTGKLFHNGHEEPVWDKFGQPTDYGPWPLKNGRIAAHPEMPDAYVERTGNSAPYLSMGRLSRIPQGNGYDGWVLDSTPWDTSDAVPFRWNDKYDRDRMPDEASADFAVEILQSEQNAPFFLAVGFVRPHTPYVLPDEAWERFDGIDLELPVVLDNDLADCAPDLAEFPEHASLRKLEHILASWPDNAGWHRFLQAYLASVLFADRQFGRVLDALQSGPYADNTIIVVTSDHGFHTGQKNRWFKQTLWERGTRIPLIVTGPAIEAAGKACPHPVTLVDLYPTLSDLCGLPIQPNGEHGPKIEGHSLRPFLEDPETDKWTGPDVALTSTTYDTLNEHHFAIRSLQYRYIFSHSGNEELYDHTVDPHEHHNLAIDPGYTDIKAELKTQLFRLVFNVSAN